MRDVLTSHIKWLGDPAVAVILLDVVLGHGSHPDPAGEMAPVIRSAQAQAAGDGRSIAFVGFVCGTPGDPQGLERQEKMLRDAGMHLAMSNAQAVRIAAAIASRAAAGSATSPPSRSSISTRRPG